MKQYLLAGLKIIYQDGRHSKEDAEHEGEQTTKQHQHKLQIYKIVALNIIVSKSETNQYCVFQFDIDALYQKNAEYEEDIRNSNSISDQFDIQIRDTGKKVSLRRRILTLAPSKNKFSLGLLLKIACSHILPLSSEVDKK